MIAASSSTGALRERYVDTGATGLNNGMSWTNAYTSLQGCITAEVAADAVLTDDDGIFYIYLRRTGAGGVDTPVTIDGFTVDTTHYLYLKQVDRAANGAWSDTAYILDNADAATAALTISDDRCVVDGLQVRGSSTGTNTRNGIHITNLGSGGFFIQNVLLKGTTWGTGSGVGLLVEDSGATVLFVNSVAFGWYVSDDIGFAGVRLQSGTLHCWNSISYGNTIGYSYVAGTADAYNCVSANNPTAEFSASYTKDYCCYVGGAGTNHDTSPNSDNWALEFTDPANGNFALLATATGCINTGTADPGGINQLDTDIIGTARPQGVAWDIGAYEYIQPSGGTVFDPGFDVGFRNGGFED
jgi:hypothetical protein